MDKNDYDSVSNYIDDIVKCVIAKWESIDTNEIETFSDEYIYDYLYFDCPTTRDLDKEILDMFFSLIMAKVNLQDKLMFGHY